MSAVISQISGRSEMFSGNNIVPWHKLGTVVSGLLTAAEAIEAAHLGWTVSPQPLFCNGRAVPFPTQDSTKDAWQAICRDDTGDVLGIMRGRYEPIQNRECFDFMDTLTQAGEIKYETAGALRQGRQVWMMAKYDGQIEINSDAHEQWLLLVTSHDGSFSLMVQWVTVRVVCANTLSLALKGAKNQVKIRHTKSWEDKAAEAKRVLGLTKDYFADMRTQLAGLNQQPLTQDDMQAFTKLLLPAKDETDVPTRTVNMRDHILDLYCRGAGNQGETRWDALNAVTDFADHHQTIRGENSTRLESAMLGSGAQLKQKAFDLLTGEDLMGQLLAVKDVAPRVIQSTGTDFSALLNRPVDRNRKN